jgi:hypothetical protein
MEWQSSLKRDSFCPTGWQVSGWRTITRKTSDFSSSIFCRYAGPWQNLYMWDLKWSILWQVFGFFLLGPSRCATVNSIYIQYLLNFRNLFLAVVLMRLRKNVVPGDKHALPDRWTLSKAGPFWMFLGPRQSPLVMHLYSWNHRQQCVPSCISDIFTKSNCISTAPGNKFR